MLGRTLPDILGPRDVALNCLEHSSISLSISSTQTAHSTLLAPSGDWLCAETRSVAATPYLTACLARVRARATTSSSPAVATTGLQGPGFGNHAPSTSAIAEYLAEDLLPEAADFSSWAHIVDAQCCGQQPDCPSQRGRNGIIGANSSSAQWSLSPFTSAPLSAGIPIPVSSALQTAPTNSAAEPSPPAPAFAGRGSRDYAETPPPEPPVSASSFQTMRRNSGGSSTDSLYDLSPASSLKSLGGSDSGGSNGASALGKYSRSNSGSSYSRDSSCERSCCGRDSSFGRSDSYGSSGASSYSGSSGGESHLGGSRCDDNYISNGYKYARSARAMHLPGAAGKVPSHALTERRKGSAHASGPVPGMPSLVSSRRRLWSIAHSGEDMEEGFSSGGAFERDFRDQRRQARGPSKYGCRSFDDDDDSSSDSNGGGGAHDQWRCSPPLKSQASLLSLVDGLNLQSSVALHQASMPASGHYGNDGEVPSNSSIPFLAPPNLFAVPQDSGTAFRACSELDSAAPTPDDWGWFTEEDDFAPSAVCV